MGLRLQADDACFGLVIKDWMHLTILLRYCECDCGGFQEVTGGAAAEMPAGTFLHKSRIVEVDGSSAEMAISRLDGNREAELGSSCSFVRMKVHFSFGQGGKPTRFSESSKLLRGTYGLWLSSSLSLSLPLCRSRLLAGWLALCFGRRCRLDGTVIDA